MSDRAGATGTPSPLAFPLIAVLTAYLIFIGGGWGGIFLLEPRVISLVLIAAVLGVWFVIAWRGPGWRPSSHLLPVLVLGLAVLVIATVFSRQPRLAFDYIAYAVLLVGLYLFLVRLLAHDFFRDRFMGLAVILAVAIGVAYVAQVGSSWITWWGLVGRLTTPPLRPDFAGLTYGNPSGVLTMSVLLTVPALAFVGWRTRGRAALAVLLVALAGFCVLASGSRAGWLALAIASVLFAVAWLAVAEHRRQVGRFIHTPAARLVVAALVAGAGIVGVIIGPGVISRATAGGETLRLTFYQSALRMFADSPLIGTGPGTWVALRAAYTTDPGNDYYIPHAHDVYLQTLSELGIVGAVAGAIGVSVVGRLIVRAIRSDDRQRVWLGWATLFTLTYLAAHQVLDFYASMPAALAAAAIPIAYLDATDREPAGFRLPLPRPIPAIAGVALVALAVAWLGLSESRAAVHARAVAALADRDWTGALTAAREVATADPDLPVYQFTLGLAALNAAHPQEAADAFARAAGADDLPESWLGLATAQVDLGDKDGASRSLAAAMRLGQVQAAVALGAGQLYEEIGDLSAARRAYVSALAGAPSLAGDPGLDALVQPATTVDDLADETIRHLPGSGAAVQIALELGHRQQAEELARACSPQDAAAFATIIPAWFDDPGGRRALAALARDKPLDNTLQLWAAVMAARSGDVAEAARFGVIAVINETSTSREPGEYRLAPPGDPQTGGGISTAFYGHFSYRRPVAPNMIPASLTGLKGT